MFGLELNLSQKIQIGFIVVMFTIAGFLVYRGTRPTIETTVTSWVDTRNVGIDPSRPVSAKNPADPAKTITITIFAFHDGHLEITEYPPDANIKPYFVFRPDLKRPSYDLYKSPMTKVNAITDPYKRTLATYAYNLAEGHPDKQNHITKLGLSKDQIDAEKDLRQKMLDQVDILQQNAKTGLYLPEKCENVIRALADYKARESDPAKDSAKQTLAHKVINCAMEYLNQMYKDESVAVEQYIDGVDTLLDSDQKTKLGEIGKILTTPKAPRPAHGRNAG